MGGEVVFREQNQGTKPGNKTREQNQGTKRGIPANAIADLTGRVLCVILELHPEEGRKPEMV
jgi:hypothetical protein